MSRTLEALRAALGADGALLAGARLADPVSAPGPTHGARAAAGPRAAAAPDEYALVVEAIREGYELHYGSPRVVDCGGDEDLALLVGDRLYAFGLVRLAALGDLEAVAELADVIALSALAHAAGTPAVADAVWEAGTAAVGRGGSEPHAAAKALARAGGDPAAAATALRAAAALTNP